MTQVAETPVKEPGFLERLGAKTHVQGHLITGRFIKKYDARWLILFLGITICAMTAVDIARGAAKLKFEDLLPVFCCIFSFFAVKKLSRTAQAALMWIVIKIVAGLVAFLFIICGTVAIVAPSGLGKNPPSPYTLWLLALVWVPGPEFLPRVTPRQYWITWARILLTVCLVGLDMHYAHSTFFEE